jgi:predicted nucleic acid-binding protein
VAWIWIRSAGVAGDGESQSLQLARSSRGEKPVMRTFGLRRRAVPLGLSVSGWLGPGTALTELAGEAGKS